MEIVDNFTSCVSCCGKELIYDHPKIYLAIDPELKQIACPYCGKEFRLVEQS